MFNEILEKIDGIGIYPLMSLLTFIIFFAAVIVWSLKVKKSYLKKMESIPFDDGENTSDLE